MRLAQNIMAERDIFVTEEDYQRLSNVLLGAGRNPKNREHVEHLEAELDRAHVVPPTEIPPDVVTMNSEIALRDQDTGEEMVYTLVFPGEANVSQRKLSILAPLGTAVLGYRAGDIIEWTVPGGTRRLEVQRVIYQPERDR